jgi:PAS domain S-box-containing protein
MVIPNTTSLVLIVNSIATPVILFHQERILLGNTAASELLAYPPEALNQLTWYHLIPQNTENTLHKLFSNQGGQLWLMTANGQLLDSEWAIQPAPFAGQHCFMATLRRAVTVANTHMDKTLPNNHENALFKRLRQYSQRLENLVNTRNQELQEERRRLQIILDTVREGIFYMEDYTFQYANPAFCRMVGYTVSELVGQTLSLLRIPIDTAEVDPFLLLLLEEESKARNETGLRCRDGRIIYVRMTFTLVGNPGEQPTRVVAAVHDITAERQLQEQRSRFIANAAHELRTPLTSFGLRLHMLRKQPEKAAQHLDNLERVTAYMKHLVEEMVDLTRFEKGVIELNRAITPIQPLILEAMTTYEPIARQKQIVLVHDMPKEKIVADVDRHRIVQLVANLIVNGIQDSSPQSEVIIRLQQLSEPGVDYVLLEVEDSGEGIPAELLPDAIFAPFSRPGNGNHRTTAFGLALAREIVTLHGGIIRAQSIVGTGSIFSVYLPLPPEAADAQQWATPSPD